MNWFGSPWPSPAWPAPVCSDPDRRVEVPVGQICLSCTEAVRPTDSGVTMPHWRADGNVEIAPQHVECFVRHSLGGLAHMEGVCSCQGAPGLDPAEGMSSRQEALVVFAHVMSKAWEQIAVEVTHGATPEGAT